MNHTELKLAASATLAPPLSPTLAPPLDLSEATFAISALFTNTYALWWLSMLVTSQNMIFCSCSHCSRRSSIYSLRCSSIISLFHLSFFIMCSSVFITIKFCIILYSSSPSFLFSFSLDCFYLEVELSWQEGWKSFLGLGWPVVDFLTGGWAFLTWPASCWIQVMRTSQNASPWANNGWMDKLCLL